MDRSLSRMLHDILDYDHIQWQPPLIRHYTNFWPLLIWTLLPNLTFYLIVRGFHRTFATGAACQQRTLTPLDTWSCPTLGLACVLMSRPISPELVLFRTLEFRTSLGTSLLLANNIWIGLDQDLQKETASPVGLPHSSLTILVNRSGQARCKCHESRNG